MRPLGINHHALPLEGAPSRRYFVAMNTVEEIEQAAEQLAPSEFARLARWISGRYHERWTRQMDRHAADGKLDFLYEGAAAERQAGTLRQWPSDKE